MKLAKPCTHKNPKPFGYHGNLYDFQGLMCYRCIKKIFEEESMYRFHKEDWKKKYDKS